MPTSDLQLKRWHNFYNKKWFKGALPSSTMLRYEVVHGGQAEVDPNGLPPNEVPHGTVKVGDLFLVRIHPAIAWSPRNSRFAVIHEMAHISVGLEQGHGKKFQAEMLRLASAGAFRDLW